MYRRRIFELPLHLTNVEHKEPWNHAARWSQWFNAHCGGPQRMLLFHVCTPHIMYSRTTDNCTQWHYNYITLTKLMYTAPTWWGFAQEVKRVRIDSFIRRTCCMGYLPHETPEAAVMVGDQCRLHCHKLHARSRSPALAPCPTACRV